MRIACPHPHAWRGDGVGAAAARGRVLDHGAAGRPAGYDAVWVGDSIVAKPRLEPLTTLAYLAGITTRVRLGTAVLLPALRHPVVLAQQIANVDQISRGRLVLGLGVGWSLPRRARVGGVRRRPQGAGAAARGARRDLAEALDGRAGDPSRRRPGPGGPHHRAAAVEPAGPPVLITAGNRGELLPAQFERFGRLGDGIITTYVHVEEMPDRARARAGGAGAARPAPCGLSALRVHDGAARRRRGTAERVTTEFLATYYGGGVHERGAMGLGPAAW